VTISDPGLQPERTALAWRRTSLALVVGSLAAVRVLPQLIGAWGYAAAGLAFAVSVGILIASHRRYLSRVPSGGGLIGATALVVLLAGVAALVAILGSALPRP
jgi:uncharacterized membrane protein YidH (DUF202 family)